MTLIPLSSLANGTLFKTVPFVGVENPTGAPLLTPAVGQAVYVMQRGTDSQATVYTDSTGQTVATQPLTADASGAVPGYIDQSTLPLDLVAGSVVFELPPIGTPVTKEAILATGLTAADIGADAAGAAASAQSAAEAASDAKGAATTAQAAAEAASDAAGTASTLVGQEQTRAEAAEALLIPLAQKGAANGVATLGADGQVPAGQLAHAGGGAPVSFSYSGALTAVNGAGVFPVPAAGTITSVRAAVGTAPTGASIIVDVDKNGSTVFTTTANRPTIAAGAQSSPAEVPDVTSVAAGDLLSVNIAQVGTTVPGSDLTVVVYIKAS